MAKIKRDPRLMELAKQSLEIYEPTSAGDVYDGLKEMLGGTIESMLKLRWMTTWGTRKVSMQTTLRISGTDLARRLLSHPEALLRSIFHVTGRANLTPRL